jgi:transcriptional antiterminator NusG
MERKGTLDWAFREEQYTFPASYLAPCWYAAYVCANHEIRVAEQLSCRSVEHFLPRYESTRCWKDRRVRSSLPLFPGYVFVRLALRDHLQVLRVPSPVRLVEFNRTPVPLPDGEIEVLRTGLAQGIYAEPRSYLAVGRHVRVARGPLEGMAGNLIKKEELGASRDLP